MSEGDEVCVVLVGEHYEGASVVQICAEWPDAVRAAHEWLRKRNIQSEGRVTPSGYKWSDRVDYVEIERWRVT